MSIPKSKAVVILAFSPPSEVLRNLKEKFRLIDSSGTSLSTAEILQLAVEHQAYGLMVSTEHRLGGEKISALPSSVKVIATSSVGFDHPDRPSAKARGIILTNTPSVLSEDTANLGFLLLLNVSRRAREY